MYPIQWLYIGGGGGGGQVDFCRYLDNVIHFFRELSIDNNLQISTFIYKKCIEICVISYPLHVLSIGFQKASSNYTCH